MARNKYRSGNRFYISDLKILVYVIGYRCYGESIVFLIKDSDKVYYSIVIDSYQYKPSKGSPFINKAADILRDHKVEHLDLLCWTHPHDDHSKGITTIIEKYCDEDTFVIYPANIENNVADIVEMKQVSKDAVNKILEINRNGAVRACPIGVVQERYNNIDEFRIIDSYDDNNVRNVRINAITPISNMLTRYVNRGKCDDPNELSVSLVIDINDFGFYFGGDTTNEHIDASNKDLIGKCRFIKIPHHASATADHLLSFLNKEKIDAVCTSVFTWGRSSNPNPKVIKSYQTYFKNIYSTNINLKKEGYGIILYKYDFSRGYPVCNIYTEGNVGKFGTIQ